MVKAQRKSPTLVEKAGEFNLSTNPVKFSGWAIRTGIETSCAIHGFPAVLLSRR
jgi:hypothetical protein